jgi:chromosome segregation ATPase
MTWLEDQGAQAVKEKAQRYLRDLMDRVVREINTHTTTEMEKLMTEINDLHAAVDQELADDSAQNQLLSDRAATIADLEARLAEAQGAVDGAVAGEAEAKATLQEALSGVSDAVTKLKSNDPQPEEPTEEPTP